MKCYQMYVRLKLHIIEQKEYPVNWEWQKAGQPIFSDHIEEFAKLMRSDHDTLDIEYRAIQPPGAIAEGENILGDEFDSMNWDAELKNLSSRRFNR